MPGAERRIAAKRRNSTLQTILEFLRQTWTGVAEAWGQLSMNARVQIGLAGALVAAFLIGVVVMGGSQSYVRLYDRLEAGEISQIRVWLDEQGYDHRLTDGGQVIEVPLSDISAIRVGVAALGLPTNQSGSPGLEIFETRGIMTSDRLTDIDYQRALNGIAQRQLNTQDYIRSSQVFISQAPRAFFANEQERSQAAVTLEITRTLSEGEVAAALLIVQSIGGHSLSANDITIVAEGKVLHKPTNDEFALLAADRFEFKQRVEAHYQRKIEQALTILGEEATVLVSASFDWSSEETTARTFDLGLIISLQETTSETTVIQRPPVGTTGVSANLPEGAGTNGEPITKTETSDVIENSELPETVTSTSTPAGRLAAMKVVIMVNGTQVPVLDDDGNETGDTDYAVPEQGQLDAIEQLAMNAVASGIADPQISVEGYQFKRLAAAAAGVVIPPNWWQNSALQLGGQLLLMLIAFFVIRSFMRRAMVAPEEEVEEVEAVVEIDEEAERRKRVAEEVERLSREEPEAVASLLRTWMTED